MTTRKPVSSTAAPPIPAASYAGVHEGIVALVQGARHAAARSVNALMTSTYWEIGRRIVQAEQQGKRRANYGDVLVKRLAVDLTAQFGRGFGWRNLFQMRAFYLAWPDILQTASAVSAIAAPADQKLQAASAISETALAAAPSLAAIASRFPLPLVSLRPPAGGGERRCTKVLRSRGTARRMECSSARSADQQPVL
jgi:hypothetical protein